MLGEVDSSIFFATFVKKRIKWVVYPLNELHIEVDLARKRIFALQFAPLLLLAFPRFGRNRSVKTSAKRRVFFFTATFFSLFDSLLKGRL